MDSKKSDEITKYLDLKNEFSQMTSQIFNKLFAIIKPQVIIKNNEFLNKTLGLLKTISKQIKLYSKNIDHPIAMISLNQYILEFMSIIKNININPQAISKIITKLISILIHSLLLSESSEISSILKTIFSLTFNTSYYDDETIIKQINKLFKTIEPKGKSLILNPLSIEIIKLDTKDKNNYLSFILEHIYHSGLLNENIITLMTSIVDFPNETSIYIDSFCCEYAYDFTVYLFCNYLLYYQYLTIKQSNKERNDCIGILHQLVNKMINDIVNIDICLFIEKIKFSIMLLMIYKKEVNLKTDHNRNQDDILIKMLTENKSKIDIFLHCFLNMINIDLIYDMLKQYLNDIISNLSNKINILLKYETTRIMKYMQKESWKEKTPLLCLYLNLLENISNNNSNELAISSFTKSTTLFTPISKVNNHEKQILHYAPVTHNINFQNTTQQFLFCENNNDSLKNYDRNNKKYLLKEVLNNLFILLKMLNSSKINTMKNKENLKYFQVITLCFNIIKTTTNVQYGDVILNFIISYINYRKNLIINEWESIFNIIRLYYSINHEFTQEIKIIISLIEELKYNNNFHGNITSLKTLLIDINESSHNLFFIMLCLEFHEKEDDILLNNINNLFSLIIIEPKKDNLKEKPNIKPIFNEVITQNQLKIIYNLILKIFYDIQSEGIYLLTNSLKNQSKIQNLSIIKQILIKKIPKLLELLINNKNKSSFIYDLLLFTVDLITESNDHDFNTNILNQILTLIESSSSLYKIVLPLFIKQFSKSLETIPKLQIVFDIIETHLKYIMTSQNKITTDFSGVFLSILCNSKVLNNCQIEKTPIKINKKNNANKYLTTYAYLNTGIIMDYLIFVLNILTKQSNGILSYEQIHKIKAGIIILLSTNFLILKGMNFFLYFDLIDQLIEISLNTMQKMTCSEKRARILLKNDLNCYLYFLTNIAFHLDIENSNMKCTLLLSDGVSDYSTLKLTIIKNLVNKLNFLANNILVKNKKIENKFKKATNFKDTSLLNYNKSSENIKGFVKIFLVLEIYLFSISCNKNNYNIIKSETLYAILKSIIDICATLVCLAKYFYNSISLRFLVYKFFFMTKEIFSLYDDISLHVIFLIFNLSNENDLVQRFIQNSTIISFFDKHFMQKILYFPNDNLNNTNNKHEFQLSKIPFLEVSFDYLVNYYIINAKNKDNFYTYFLILFEAFKEMNNLNSHSNKKDLLNINYIRQKIFFENINWCFSSNLNRDNLVKPNYKKYNENKMFPNFYIDKETYGLLLSYEQNLNEDQYTINIRTAVSNIQYSITQNILSSNNEIHDLNNYVISSLSQIHSKVSLQKISIDDEFISLLNSLDTLSIYRNIHCKIFFRNVSLLNGKLQIIENPLISEDFISFLNALGVLNKRSSTNEKIIVTSYDINNKIQYEYMETNQLIASKIENKVTIIWCTTTEIHLNNEVISSVNDNNEFYIIVYPVSNSHFLVKIENALNINLDIFNKLFQNENVIYIGEKYEVLAEYVSKMVLILNLFSKFNVLNEKQKNAKNEKISDSLEDILHNHDTLFQRCLKIYTIANKYKKSE